MITVKELAAKCDVSEQSIRNYCNKIKVTKQKSNKGKPTFFIDAETETAIIQHFTEHSETSKQVNKTSKQETNPHLQEYIDSLKQQIETLNNQLNIKDKQIEQQQLTIQTLTAQLETAQQLNAGTTKALLNLTAPEERSESGATQEEQPEQKQSFFARLFRRKSR